MNEGDENKSCENNQFIDFVLAEKRIPVEGRIRRRVVGFVLL